MPQITLEYSANLAPQQGFQALFEELHRILTESGSVRLENCKSRAVRRDEFRVGDGSDRGAFVHVSLQLLKGRSAQWKRGVGQRYLDALIRTFETQMDEFDVQITVSIGDIIHETYFKYPPGTPSDAAGDALNVS